MRSDPARSAGFCMRIAFVSIPRFPCAVEIARQPGLADVPLIVGDAEQPRRVFERSPEAHRWGVKRGMNIRMALRQCPHAIIVPPDPVLYRSLWESALTAFAGITPEIE